MFAYKPSPRNHPPLLHALDRLGQRSPLLNSQYHMGNSSASAFHSPRECSCLRCNHMSTTNNRRLVSLITLHHLHMRHSRDASIAISETSFHRAYYACAIASYLDHHTWLLAISTACAQLNRSCMFRFQASICGSAKKQNREWQCPLTVALASQCVPWHDLGRYLQKNFVSASLAHKNRILLIFSWEASWMPVER